MSPELSRTLLAGCLAETVFEPALLAHQPLAQSVGRIIGSGPGRGIGLLLILMGLVKLGIGGLMWASRSVRTVERDLPDEGFATIRPAAERRCNGFHACDR